MTKVKICGITNLEDALLSVKFGADALGFNFYQKSPRYITPENAGEIIEKLPENVLKVGVFVNESLEKIAEIAKTSKLNALQLHGEETPEFAKELKAKTNLEIIKAFRVSPEFKPEDVLQYEVDAILLDAYNPKEHGGTGETFDWKVAFKVKQIVPNLYLAGGLDSQNVDVAIRRVQPFAVDSCSLLEKEKGKKDKQKLFRFICVTKKGYKIRDIYDLFFLIEMRPEMYLGKKSIIYLSNYIRGFFHGIDLAKYEFDSKGFDEKFTNVWAAKKLFGKDYSPTNPWYQILEKAENDEEKAFDLFFALLEEFKLEKETDSDQVNF